jgi:hypothetical protein
MDGQGLDAGLHTLSYHRPDIIVLWYDDQPAPITQQLYSALQVGCPCAKLIEIALISSIVAVLQMPL